MIMGQYCSIIQKQTSLHYFRLISVIQKKLEYHYILDNIGQSITKILEAFL